MEQLFTYFNNTAPKFKKGIPHKNAEQIRNKYGAEYRIRANNVVKSWHAWIDHTVPSHPNNFVCIYGIAITDVVGSPISKFIALID